MLLQVETEEIAHSLDAVSERIDVPDDKTTNVNGFCFPSKVGFHRTEIDL